MSGRRAKQLRASRRKTTAPAPRNLMAMGVLMAYTAFGADAQQAAPQMPAPKAGGSRPPATLELRKFDIAAGPLDVALRTYETLTDVKLTVAMPKEVLTALTTSGVSGSYTDQEALTQLLAGSGIEARFRGRRAATLNMQLAETIDVTGIRPISSPKYVRPNLETPQTISVISGDVIATQGATSLRDVLRNTPGITFQAGEGGGGLPGDTFSMRGFSSGNDITVDGIREVGAYTRDSFNLEQVEVVKGPTSATAGRGSTGGSINLVTKSPGSEASRSATAGVGSEGYTRATVDMNEPLSLIPNAAWRLNVMGMSAGVARRDVVENRSWGLAPSLAVGLGQPTRLVASWQHIEQDNVPDYGLPWAAFETNPRVDQSSFYGLRDYDYETVKGDLASVTVEHDLGTGWALRNTSRFAENHRDSAITSPRPPNRQLQQRTLDNTQLANHTNLGGSFQTGFAKHAVAAGIELSRETKSTRSQSQTANQPQTSLTNPDPTQRPFGPLPVNVGNPDRTALDLVGVYVLDTVQLGPKWQVNGGLRWDSIDIDYNLLTVATGVRTELAKRDRMLSWNGGLLFKPRTNASLYASAGTSFNPSVENGGVGAALSDVPTAANNINLEPEKSRNFEIGGKWELRNGRAAATMAVFRTEKTNARTRNLTTEPFVLAGMQRVDGVEVGITGRISERWSLLTSYSHLDSEFVESANPAEVGAALALTPKHSGNVWATGTLPRGITVGAGAQYMGRLYRNSINTLSVPDYWLFSAMASYAVGPRLTLRLNANNLGDAVYVDRVGGGHYVPGAGRNFVLSAGFDF